MWFPATTRRPCEGAQLHTPKSTCLARRIHPHSMQQAPQIMLFIQLSTMYHLSPSPPPPRPAACLSLASRARVHPAVELDHLVLAGDDWVEGGAARREGLLPITGAAARKSASATPNSASVGTESSAVSRRSPSTSFAHAAPVPSASARPMRADLRIALARRRG